MNNINYAYKSGVLEGTLTSMTYLFKIPGVEITDREAFTKFIESEIDRARQTTAEYSKTNPNYI
jgi:hypothetical protein